MSPLPAAPGPPPRQDGQLRTAYQREVLHALYPASGSDDQPAPGPGGQPAPARDGGGVRELLVLPHARRPRLLIPAGSRRLAAAAVRHGAEPQSGRARAARVTASAALRAGAGVLLPDRVRVATTGSLEEHLRELLGEPVSLAIHIGPARANRKPVAELFDRSGRTLGFLKLGTNPLTRRLVRAESSALAALSRLPLSRLAVPQVRHAGQWGGHQLLVQSALPVWRRRGARQPHRVALAMREVALCCGVTHGLLATSPYWKGLVERVQALAAGGTEEAAALAAAVRELGERGGDLELRYGAWHGDWAPWNMAYLTDTLLVWDWERFTVGVPLGFDAVHFDLQQRLRRSADPAAAVAATVAVAGRLLTAFEVAPPARRPTALLYLADLAARYLADRQAQAGARLGVLGTWLLPVLTHQLEDLP